MPSEISNLVDAAESPPDVNPYDAIAKMLEKLLQPPTSPRWSRRLKIASVVFYFLIFFQAVYLLYQRSRISPWFKLRRNTLSLIVVDISCSSGLVYFFYAPPTVYTMLSSLLSEGKYQPRGSTILLIFCHKFFPLLLGSWAFLSFCACQCAMIFWNSNWASNMNRERLQRLIKWVYHTFFVGVAFIPLPFMTWTYVKAYKNLREMETIVINLSSMLHHKANAYDPHKVGAFSASSDLGQLQSAMKLAPLRLEVANNLRHGLIIYCIDTCLLIVIYAPLLWISFRGLYDRSSPSENVEAALGPVKPVKKNPISRKLNRDRRRLVSHALCVYVSTTLHLPPLILMLTRNVDNFMTDLTRREITYHGLNDPLAVMANIILLILNVNSHHIIRAQKKTNRLDPPYRPPACAADPIPEQQRGILKGLNDRSSKGSIVADNIHIALDNLHENVEYDEKVSPWAICATPGDLDPIRPLSGCDPPTNYSAR